MLTLTEYSRASLPAASFDFASDDQRRFLRVVREALRVRRHLQLLRWLQGDVQYFVPHEVLIAAWGDFSRGLLQYDVVTALPGLRTGTLRNGDITPFVRRLFDHWVEQDGASFALHAEHGICIQDPVGDASRYDALRGMRTALVHGIRDERGRHDCLYVALHPELIPVGSEQMLGMLLPYIDTALRQISQLPSQSAYAETECTKEFADLGLSTRELEIMDWVSRGKTNLEIGMILDISAFTVKNHLQRVFRKLDVTNRAQAVAAFEQLAHNGRG